MRWAFSVVLPFVLAGCLPDLSFWEVVPEGFEGGRPRIDVVNPPPDDCASPRPIGAGYSEGFETGAGGWGVAGANSTWALGTPQGAQIVSAASGNAAWMTGLGFGYASNEDSYVYSPCFDASTAADDLLITLSRAYHTESSYDYATLEFTTDGGTTWEIASGETRLAFYWSSGWTGDSDWQEAATLLPGTARQARVQVRIHFESDGATEGEGFAFDDVSIRPSTQNLEMRVVEADRCGYAVATVRNVGGQPVTGYEISTDIDGATDIMTFDETLDYLETREIEFGAGLANLARASVFAISDTNALDDTMSVTFVTVPLPSSGYFSDFEADGGGLIVTGDNPSWEWGDPNGALINSAPSGTRAWVTNLDGDYNANENAYLITPCYDLSTASRDPQIALDRVFRTEECCDYANVEMSIDGGSFVRVGSNTSGGTNWYTTWQGWQGSSGAGAWQNASHPLVGTRGHSAVRIRIGFHSDGSTQYEGFGIDNLAIIP